jgi:gamma-glutamylcyclotransferase (GGCT)/AIG2-like uncharacterized protein YtfP
MEFKTPTSWWTKEPLREVSDIVSFINNAVLQSDDVEFCNTTAKALNRLWTQLFKFQKRNGHLKPEHAQGRGDTAAFEELLRVTIRAEDKPQLLRLPALDQLVALTPKVMSHDVLRREDYDPSAIPNCLRQKASEKHSELADAVDKWRNQQTPQSTEKALKKLADLIFVIRSNIAHGEKTSHGPDLEKTTRDQAVCRLARPVMAAITRAIFDQPDRRIAVYGTLRPGEPNHSKLSRLQGVWRDAQVRGNVFQDTGLPHFVWDVAALEIQVKIFESANLEKSWAELDRFEGQSYQRIWVVASLQDDGALNVANIYALNSRTSDV